MFTGIVRELGEVDRVERAEGGVRLGVRARLADELADGDSIAVSGACLTAATVADGAFEADVTNQTLELTTLGALASGDQVNLEPALSAGDRLGGHIVQGHVDATAEVTDAIADGIARRLAVAVPPELRRYVVERGSVALDGVSLTVAALTVEGLEVSLIPETLARTTLGRLAPGSTVNLEVDLIARYAERLLQTTGTEG
jgi:riboflavin synthase